MPSLACGAGAFATPSWQRRQAYYMAKADGRIRVAERKPKEKIDRHTRAIELAED